MKPTFKLGKSHRYIVDDRYFTNGHYLIVKARLTKSDFVSKSVVLAIQSAAKGVHPIGLFGDPGPYTHDLNRIIPARDGYIKAGLDPVGVDFDQYKIKGYFFSAGDIKALISSEYAGLLDLGHIFIKDDISPVLVLAGGDITDELIAIVMPLRQKVKK